MSEFDEYRQFLPDFDEFCRETYVPEDAEEKQGEVRFTISGSSWRYLSWLVRNTVLGKTENDVARQLLTERLAAMRQEDYRDGQKS